MTGKRVWNRVNLSFKNNDRDTALYSYIATKHDKSAFIKDCIEFYLSHQANGSAQVMQQPIQQVVTQQQQQVTFNTTEKQTPRTPMIKFGAKRN